MDSKLQPVQLYGFSKSRLYEPLGTAIFFRNRFCPVSWILVFLPVHFGGHGLHGPHSLCDGPPHANAERMPVSTPSRYRLAVTAPMCWGKKASAKKP